MCRTDLRRSSEGANKIWLTTETGRLKDHNLEMQAPKNKAVKMGFFSVIVLTLKRVWLKKESLQASNISAQIQVWRDGSFWIFLGESDGIQRKCLWEAFCRRLPLVKVFWKLSSFFKSDEIRWRCLWEEDSWKFFVGGRLPFMEVFWKFFCNQMKSEGGVCGREAPFHPLFHKLFLGLSFSSSSSN